ncbi:hypothetical protein MKZ38_004406 [Zalerion maritima]|uniref:Aminoglycoside phosphotransferase domain-containing protein n=1 Tax=Zalerion maritima TaxID=339359 RepID=A0AAD5RLH2_9PEZI|nr:hypothetical protein MKZ38_004406 [Zalerion maritima]
MAATMAISRYFDCSECGAPSSRAPGAGCDICQRHFCAKHMGEDSHGCSQDYDDATWRELVKGEVDRLRERVDDGALCRLASRLNGGKACSIEHLNAVGPGATMGCANYHARIRFETGTKTDTETATWFVRFPRITGFAVGFPERLAEFLLKSEFATLKFLATKTRVPVAEVYWCGVPGENTDEGVGVPFLLMGEIQGKTWDGEAEKSRVLGQWGEILTELSRHPFDKGGSLICPSGVTRAEGSDEQEVGKFASDRFVVIDPYGPCYTAKEYYEQWCEGYLELIADGQLYPGFEVDAYLFYRFLKEKVGNILKEEGTAAKKEDFFLKHVDDKGDHIMVDGGYNIVGVIDWQMARLVPRREAFGPSIITANMADMYDGNVGRSEGDARLTGALRMAGEDDLADSMAGDDLVRRFVWGLALETKWKYAKPMAEGLLAALGEKRGFDIWRGEAIGMWKNDERLASLTKGRV